ncbi:NEL-type E3 ubiquitin ligase domain-containing protein [Pseudomonas helleri]|uniref:NEL-type E3 ubiquitin ligase domain-containing protein n=1 Tax=Pseudomonas helleri TaxID=1608996 RepID=UPI00381F38FF
MTGTHVVQVAGPHGAFIKDKMPSWVKHSHPSHIQRLRAGLFAGHVKQDQPPEWFTNAAPWLREALLVSQERSRQAHVKLATKLQGFKGIAEFAEPILVEAMKGLDPSAIDVNKNSLYYLRRDQPVHEQSLLQAALLNFTGNEDFSAVVGGAASVIAPVGALVTEKAGLTAEWSPGFSREEGPGLIRREHTRPDSIEGNRYRFKDQHAIAPQVFSQVCRQLDLGKQYQDHLSSIFDDPATRAGLRHQMIAAQKEQLAVRLHTGLMVGDVKAAGYEMVRGLLYGAPNPRMGPLVFSGLELFGFNIGHAVIIESARSYPIRGWVEEHTGITLPAVRFDEPGPDPVMVYIPGAPISPLKEYSSLGEFTQDLAANLCSANYQQFFASLVPQGKQKDFLTRLNHQLIEKHPTPGTQEEPVYFAASSVNLRVSQQTLQPISGDIFNTLYFRQIERIKEDALAIAIPTAVVDWEQTVETLESWASMGMNVLNVAAFFVPGLGEAMMVVMALQLAKEVYDGFESWSVGDIEGAWSHLESVAMNVAFIGVMGAAGYAFSKIPAGTIPRILKEVRQAVLPTGEIRLCKPEVHAYQVPEQVLDNSEPNALGQYHVNGKTYVRVDEHVYEQTFDQSIKKWKLKHPSAQNVFEPTLEHNNAGAWRHAHEQPLEWNRATLLRRLGHETRLFDDATLGQMGDISGVSDSALRQVHMEGLPTPAVLLDTFELFRVDRELEALIEQIASSKGFTQYQDEVLRVLVEMPGWPRGQELEVFDGDQMWGPSTRYGKALVERDARPIIRITRADVAQGTLAERVLSSFSDEQAAQLLGQAEGALSPTRRFNQRLADALGRHRPHLLKRLLSAVKSASSPIEVELLRNRFPSLSERAAKEVLDTASNSELADLRDHAIVSRRIDDRARVYVQQGRMNRAIAGLFKPSLSSLDSERLALRGLEHLPGWSNDINLQIRANSSQGRLLDSIGLDQDPIHRTLIKSGDHFSVVQAAGVPMSTDLNLYEAIVQVLPELTREAMGYLDISQADDLRGALARHALSNRSEVAQILRQRILGAEPALGRINNKVGYTLSGTGKGLGVRDLQVVRLRDVYPRMSDEQALGYIEARLSQGATDQQIFDALEHQLNELQGLRSVLQAWSAERSGRSGIVSRVIECWRSGLPYNQDANIALDLGSVSQLPAWEADFSHVRALSMDAGLLVSEPGAGLLQRFPNARRLELFVGKEQIGPIAQALPALDGNTELSLTLNVGADSSAPLVDVLSRLSQLEQLSIGGDINALDVTQLSELRGLSLFGNVTQWPTGIFGLEHLELLDLRNTSIVTLPDAFFESRLHPFSTLRLNWSGMDMDTIVRAYDFLSSIPAYAAEASDLASSYVREGLRTLVIGTRVPALTESVIQRALYKLPAGVLIKRVGEVTEEYRTLIARLNHWKSQVSSGAYTHLRQTVCDRITGCWRSGLAERLGLEGDDLGVAWKQPEEGGMLDLEVGAFDDLPKLEALSFTHVTRLRIPALNVPLDELNTFLGAFKNVQTVDLSRSQLMDFPSALADLPQLSSLDLGFNELRVTPQMQESLNSMVGLKQLDLSGNWVDELDVSSLDELQELNLSSTSIKHWPAGIERCRSLRFLNLSFSALTEIPPEVVNHPTVLSKTLLQGCRLTRKSCDDLLNYGLKHKRNRVGGIGLDRLAEGVTDGEPEPFPIQVADNPDLLLPEPLTTAPDDSPLTRLQRLTPDLTPEQAQARLEQIQTGEVSIEVRLEEWEQELSALTSRLNDWVASRNYRIEGGRRWVNSADRRTAAGRILQAWRYSVARSGVEQQALDLSGLCIGDMPQLPGALNDITALNVSGTGLTQAGAQTCIRSFSQLRTLQLNNAGLTGLPESIGALQHLNSLEAAGNHLSSVDLEPLRGLESLDLSRNVLTEVDVQGMDNLQTLILSGNRLSEWPEGVLDLAQLRVLKLDANEIEAIPFRALEGNHDLLMAGTDLSNNYLPNSELRSLYDYRDFTGNDLGYSLEELQVDSSEAGSDEDSDGQSDVETDEEITDVLPDVQALADEKEPWFQDVPADSVKHEMWDVLREAPGSQYLFRLLELLQGSKDFALVRAELNQRVWEVLEAAYKDEMLRDELFSLARSRDTCPDGRMLVFNDIELKVYEFNEFGTGAASKSGQELFTFYKRMFRLGKVESIAQATANASGTIEVVEVRLAYRTALAERLDLPKQAADMLYRASAPEVTPAAIEEAYQKVILAEKGSEFLEHLTTQDHWLTYLKAQYPQEFEALQAYSDELINALDQQYDSPASEGYEIAADIARIEVSVKEHDLLLRLCGLQRALLD